jgi:hypothetical protein
MFGGFKLQSGDIVLKVSGGSSEGVERIVTALHAQSLPSKVKRKGQFFWIGFQGSNADSFWKAIEPYVLDGFLGLTTQESGSTGSGDDQDTESDDDIHRSEE